MERRNQIVAEAPQPASSKNGCRHPTSFNTAVTSTHAAQPLPLPAALPRIIINQGNDNAHEWPEEIPWQPGSHGSGWCPYLKSVWSCRFGSACAYAFTTNKLQCVRNPSKTEGLEIGDHAVAASSSSFLAADGHLPKAGGPQDTQSRRILKARGARVRTPLRNDLDSRLLSCQNAPGMSTVPPTTGA